MARRVAYYVWDSDWQDYVERPLDDADGWTLQLANAVNGRSMTDEEFARTLALFDCQTGG
jgi:hypothetical protein